MKNHDEVPVRPNKATRAKHDSIVEIVRANPGISLGGIGKLLLNSTHHQSGERLASMLMRLCQDGRVRHEDVHRYFPVGGE